MTKEPEIVLLDEEEEVQEAPQDKVPASPKMCD